MGLHEPVGENTDAVNEVVRKVHENDTADEALGYFRDSHAQLVAALGKLSDADLDKPYNHYQPGDPDQKQPVVAWVGGNTYEHLLDESQPQASPGSVLNLRAISGSCPIFAMASASCESFECAARESRTARWLDSLWLGPCGSLRRCAPLIGADGPVHQHRAGHRPRGGRDYHLADRTTATEATVSLEDGSDNATRQPTVGRSVVSGATNPRGPKRWFHTRLLQPLQGASFIIGQRPRYVLIYPRQSYPSTSIETRCPDRSTPVASDCWRAVAPSGHCWLASIPYPIP